MTRADLYHRLLRLYPKDYRDRYGAELVDTLLVTGRSPVTESLNLLRGAFVARTRRLLRPGGSWPDALAVTSLLAPILLIAGAGDGMHEIGWFIAAASSPHDVLSAFPDGPIWLLWPIVLVLGLFRLRRTTMVASWLSAAVFVIGLNERFHGFAVLQSPTGVAGWSLLAILTAVACTASDGIRRGYELVGRRRTLIAVASVLLVLFTRVLGHHYTVLYLATLAIALAATVYAAWRTRSIGARVTALLVTPTFAVAATLWLYEGAPFQVQRIGIVLPHAVYEYGLALLVLLLVVVAWRVAIRINRRRTEAG